MGLMLHWSGEFFFCHGFLVWYGYKEVITREDSFDIV